LIKFELLKSTDRTAGITTEVYQQANSPTIDITTFRVLPKISRNPLDKAICSSEHYKAFAVWRHL
jgi:hypothetical protein